MGLGEDSANDYTAAPTDVIGDGVAEAAAYDFVVADLWNRRISSVDDTLDFAYNLADVIGKRSECAVEVGVALD